jgi:hypothetical protein
MTCPIGDPSSCPKMKQRMKRSGEKPMRFCLRDPRRTMGNNEAIIKEYQNQSAVSNQDGRDPLLPLAKPPKPKVALTKGSPSAWPEPPSGSEPPPGGDMMAIPAKTNCAVEGKKIAQMRRAHLFHGVSEISLCDRYCRRRRLRRDNPAPRLRDLGVVDYRDA